MRTVSNVIARLPRRHDPELTAPEYTWSKGTPIGLAVESMKRHTTDEGWQLFLGLQHAGYKLHGYGIGPSLTDVDHILRDFRCSTMVVQDQREWDGLTADRSRDPRMRFRNLRPRPDVFTVTVLKDAQSDPAYHSASARTMGAHAWIHYYHPAVVKHLAPYVRREHMVRTYHTIDTALVPAYTPVGREGTLLSGAVSHAYPLRAAIARYPSPTVTVLAHPGYHRRGCCTPEYLRILSRFRVAICTSSVYGYALRKLVEATACGCVVVTDLPTDEELPAIDGNLVRVPHDSHPRDVVELCRSLDRSYDPEKQAAHAAAALARYDYRVEGVRLAHAVEEMRRTYAASS